MRSAQHKAWATRTPESGICEMGCFLAYEREIPGILSGFHVEMPISQMPLSMSALTNLCRKS